MSGGHHHGGGFALIVVLFILLIIVGSAYIGGEHLLIDVFVEMSLHVPTFFLQKIC